MTPSPKVRLKLFLFKVCRLGGLFHLSRRLTRSSLRILCYHNFCDDDAVAFRPSFCISPGVFEQRMRFLKERGFPVLTLHDAMAGLKDGTLPHGATVITIDDAMAGVHRWALPVLKAHGFPATVYVPTYYFRKQTPIFMLVIAYLFWKTGKTEVDLGGLGVPGVTAGTIALTEAETARLCDTIADYGDTQLDNDGRTALSWALADALEVDYDAVLARRTFSLVTEPELREMQAAGLDSQLHTHRHRFPRDRTVALQELADNRAVLEPLTPTPRVHFCYPSGEWHRDHWAALTEAGVESATTCNPGLAAPGSSSLALPRLLDDARVSEIEFEAGMYGFADMVQRLRGAVFRSKYDGIAPRRRTRRPPKPAGG